MSKIKSYPFVVKRVWKKKNIWVFRHVVYFFEYFYACKNADTIYSLSTLNGAIPSSMRARFFTKKVLS